MGIENGIYDKFFAEMIAKDAKSETAGADTYFVRYDENLFLAYDLEQRQFCYETWIAKARPMGCKRLTVQLIPDDLFPSFGNEKPYIYYNEAIAQPDAKPYKLVTCAFVEIDPNAYGKMSNLDGMKVRQEAREVAKRANCDKWYLKLGGAILEQGSR